MIFKVILHDIISGVSANAAGVGGWAGLGAYGTDSKGES